MKLLGQNVRQRLCCDAISALQRTAWLWDTCYKAVQKTITSRRPFLVTYYCHILQREMLCFFLSFLFFNGSRENRYYYVKNKSTPTSSGVSLFLARCGLCALSVDEQTRYYSTIILIFVHCTVASVVRFGSRAQYITPRVKKSRSSCRPKHFPVYYCPCRAMQGLRDLVTLFAT